MNAELDYLPFFVGEPEEIATVLEQHLGFSRQDTLTLLRGNYEAGKLMQREVTIPTDNCLRDYVKLRDAGIAIETLPYYANDGLRVAARDHAGNRFLLVEKRNYAENE